MVHHDSLIRTAQHIKDYYEEAATVDRANRWQQFWFITLPSLKNILFSVPLTLTVDMWKLFNGLLYPSGTRNLQSSLFQYMYGVRL